MLSAGRGARKRCESLRDDGRPQQAASAAPKKALRASRASYGGAQLALRASPASYDGGHDGRLRAT
jgi:hypothetical protein